MNPTGIADQLRRAIVQGRLDPGQPLNQHELAQQFGVSHIPIREALRILEAEGLVVYGTNRGAVVGTALRADLVERFELRELVEPALLRAAIPNFGPDNIRAARVALGEMAADRNAVALGDRDAIDRWGGHHLAFHRALYEPAQRPLWTRIVFSLYADLSLFVRDPKAHPDEAMDIEGALRLLDMDAEEHQAILDACEAGDVEAAAAAQIAHVRETAKMARRYVADLKDKEQAPSQQAKPA